MVDNDMFIGSSEERMRMNLNVITVKLTDGLAFGDGAISVEDRIDEQHQHALDSETLRTVEAGIHSDNILVRVDKEDNGATVEDDGCGDGRGVKTIFRKVEESLTYMKRSLNRYKVFGAGSTMATASVVGMGEATGIPVQNIFHKGINLLKRNRVPFGAHTDDHAHGDNCGCGAIDRFPLIVQNATRYRDNIADAAALLTDDTAGLDEVLDNFEAYGAEIADQPYRGRDVMEEIVDNGKVVKELVGPHLEVAIVINAVEGYTVNQDYIRQISEGKAQVFGVDVPRMQELAEKTYPDDAVKQHKAFLSMLVYTLATAATLTKGDLPVYVVSKKQTEVPALAE